MKRIGPLLLFIVLLGSTMTVFAATLYETTIRLGVGDTKQTARYNMPAGISRISLMITEINGTSNRNDSVNTRLHLIVRDGNDSAILDSFKSVDNNDFNSQIIATGVMGPAGKWYAQISNRIDGINYQSFYSNEVILASI